MAALALASASALARKALALPFNGLDCKAKAKAGKKATSA